MNWLCAALVVAIGALVGGPALGAQDDAGDEYESLVSGLSEAIRGATERGEESTLAALRALRDERLRPLFADLSTRDVQLLRLHGIFGLADLTEDRRLNVVQIANIEDREIRARAVGLAIGGDYVTTDQMNLILSWPGLKTEVELLVTMRLVREGVEFDVARLREFASGEGLELSPMSRVLAMLLLAQVDGDRDAAEVMRFLGPLNSAEQEMLLGFSLMQIFSDEMDGLDGFVVWAYERVAGNPRLQAVALSALLFASPERGVAAWQEAYDCAAGPGREVRLALVAMDFVTHFPAETFERLAADEFEILGILGRAGLAIATEQGEAEALLTVLRQRHSRAAAWVLRTLGKLSDERRAVILAEIIDMEMQVRETAGTRYDPAPAYVFDAGRMLKAEGALGKMIVKAASAGDTPVCEALLAAVIEQPPRLAWEGQTPDWPSPRTRALAAIAIARAGGSLTPEERDGLLEAAMGGVDLPGPYRAQASWLSLCEIGRDREALTRILTTE